MNKNCENKSCSVREVTDQMGRKGGRFFRMNLIKKNGNRISFVAKFRKITDKSVVVQNVALRKDCVYPFSTISSLSVG